MSPSTFPAPALESDESFVSPTGGRLFDAKLAKRLRLAESSPDPLISKSAKDLLSAERDLVYALMVIQDMQKAQRPPATPKAGVSVKAELKVKTEAETSPQAKIIQFPTPRPPKPANDGLGADLIAENDTKPHGFEPVVYSNEVTEEGDDSSLVILTADMEDDARVCSQFGFDEREEAALDEWEILNRQIEAGKLLDEILRRTGAHGRQKLIERLEHDPDFYLSKKDRGRKN